MPNRLQNRPFLSNLRRYFIGPRGLRVLWRLLLYLAISLGLSGLMFVALGRFISFTSLFPQATRGVVGPTYLLATFGIGFVADVLAALVLSRIENRSFWSYGLAFAPTSGKHPGSGKRLLHGMVVGFLAVTSVIFAIFAFGGFSFGSLSLSNSEILKFGALWAFTVFVISLMEQFRYRGYLQITLASAIGFWPAGIAISLVYAVRHLFDFPGQTWSGVLSVFLFELLFCFALRRTGNLWWPIGFQAMWDFGETFLYSVPDSGYKMYGKLLNSTMQNSPSWITGGSVGPEGSLFCFVLLAVVAFAIAKFYPARNPPAPEPKP